MRGRRDTAYGPGSRCNRAPAVQLGGAGPAGSGFGLLRRLRGPERNVNGRMVDADAPASGARGGDSGGHAPCDHTDRPGPERPSPRFPHVRAVRSFLAATAARLAWPITATCLPPPQAKPDAHLPAVHPSGARS